MLCCLLDLSSCAGLSADVLIWDREGHHGPGAISEIMKWVVLWIVLCSWRGGVFIQLCWLKRLLSLGAVLGGGKNQDVTGVLAAKVAQCKYSLKECQSSPGFPKIPRFCPQF